YITYLLNICFDNHKSIFFESECFYVRCGMKKIIKVFCIAGLINLGNCVYIIRGFFEEKRVNYLFLMIEYYVIA
ncbi:hypothetical protein, partial [Bacillus licheniformis]|uniref:hypothetical protein n=1 Tax=Bacillus licheniformis TaxID=1402 RepID=UPI001C433F84